jgi:hypothetical protein
LSYEGRDDRPLVLISEIDMGYLSLSIHHEHNRSGIEREGGEWRNKGRGWIERDRRGIGGKRKTYKIEVSSGSVSSGIPSPTDTPRGRLLAPTAEVKNPIMVSVSGKRGGGREWGDLKKKAQELAMMRVI